VTFSVFFFFPQIASDLTNTQMIGVYSGLGPSSEGGARVSMEIIKVDVAGRGGVVVHSDGAGETGF
jgi:hypothetical protein